MRRNRTGMVADNVHFLTSCDQTLMKVTALSGAARTTCMPLIQHINGQLVTPDNPAGAGEILVAWAYGLGVTNPLPPSAPYRVAHGNLQFPGFQNISSARAQ